MGRPRKAKTCMEINSGVTSHPYQLIYPVCLSLDCIDSVMPQPLIYSKKTVK
ncbi:hypothetical protein [Priestia megaterium]|uniref:hypothetical protein n=1 Tax=Priestia megaterium TaxID=1404 RepID=UPI0030003870